ncbi:MAG: urate hydroxylase PuuD [Acidobacteriota bacterium]|jgi:uncharacterized membrane protein
MSGLEQLFRWMHIFVGIIWIGLLYYFNWINGAFEGTLDPETKRKVVPELRPRALYWFRWGAAWTWITGVVLITLVFYHGGALFEGPAQEWNPGTIVMVLFTFLAVFLYDALFKSPLGKDNRTGGTIGFILIAVTLWLMDTWGGFGYRGYVIHVGAMFGTIMAFNVWFRIWPAQQRAIKAIKAGEKPDPADLAMAGGRSKHNTYLSLPLIWAMINSHTSYFAGGNLGIPTDYAWVSFLVVILLGWHIIWQCYKKSAKVKGF